MTKSRNILAPRTVWTDAQLQVLRDQYPNRRASEIADQLGMKLHVIYKKAKTLGLKKSEEFKASEDACRLRRGDNIGAEYRFRKGNVPPNKGIRQPGLAIGRMAETQFKKGTLPKNYMPIGSERFSKEGYLLRKLSDTGYPPKDWVPVHHIIWRDSGHEIPKGHALKFKNGDKTDIRLDNLYLISRADLMRQNTIHQYGPEIVSVTRLRASLTRQINRKEKNQ